MQRNPDSLCDTEYDVVVLGAGIHGSCVARDAALRGLRVALIDRGDFGNATSHNSFKIIHGGLRYLQHMDFWRVRESINETRFWRQAAPHLVRPLKFVIPTRGHSTRGPEALWAGLRIHGLIGFDRNKDVRSGWHMPAGHVMSKKECHRLIPGLEDEQMTGGAAWYDGQMQDSDRVLMECVLSAVAAGADVANYMSVIGFLGNGETVTGVRAVDLLGQNEIEIRGSCTVNACGPWVSDLLRHGGRGSGGAAVKGLVKGMNLVTRKICGTQHAIGVASKRSSDAVVGDSQRLYFISPWRDRSLIGTTHFNYDGDPDAWQITNKDVADFLGEVNAAYPPAQLSLEDVYYCYSGLTPGDGNEADEANNRARHSDIVDHDKLEGVSGIVSVVGVKFTTARLVAEHTVDLVFQKMRKTPPPCIAKELPLPGAVVFDGFCTLDEELQSLPHGTPTDNIRYLYESFGMDLPSLAGLEVPGGQSIEEVLFRERCRVAVQKEMAVCLPDLVFRRTDFAARGAMTLSRIEWCADLMAAELGWTADRREAEVDHVRAEGQRRYCKLLPDAGKITGRHRDAGIMQ